MSLPSSRPRLCSKIGCSRGAASTLTYVYSEQAVVVGPLAREADPHGYDLCAEHTDRLTPPRGWALLRLDIDLTDPTGSVRDIGALAEVVRDRRATVEAAPGSESAGEPAADGAQGSAHGHLRLVHDRDDAPREERSSGH
ncbi:Protein of unknown function [Kytococcus aerolatus]|uniref:DUF3499 domain-containing protein n=1 Tax=Kytococcus aerolatus TaxID=592308 RepID=A0A212U006_9MICO|nr:DUF3499 domain-containing protein [Kytococcus aerolatus]SNC71464.1 Protein of unknown function [Kytococcus aerolatus]